MTPERGPEIRELDRDEIDAILARNHVGRIGYSFRDRVDIEPIHYIYDGEQWIWGRTSPGAKITTIRHNYWVAFEVDEVEGPSDWRSVIVHGGFYALPPDVSGPERETRERGIELLRSVAPATLTDEDPTPGRTIVFRIAVQDVTGRESWSGEPT